MRTLTSYKAVTYPWAQETHIPLPALGHGLPLTLDSLITSAQRKAWHTVRAQEMLVNE